MMYAAEEMKGNRDFVLALVKERGLVLGYVAEEMKADREIVLAAVMQTGGAMRC